MRTSPPTLTAGALATLAVAAAPANAQEEQRLLGNQRVIDVSAHSETAVVTRQGSRRSFALAQLQDGQASWLKIPSSREAYVPDVGINRRGDHVVVYSRPDRGGDHDVYEYHLGTGRERKLPVSTRGADERFPSIWLGEVVFLRTGSDSKRNGIYRRAAFGPKAGKDIRIWKTSVARSTDTEDGEISFETDVRSEGRKGNGIYVVREDSSRPRLAAMTHTDDEGHRTVVGSASISGGYLTYLRYDSNREPQHTVFRALVDGTATDNRTTSRPADATHVAIAGPRLFFVRSGQKGLTEVTGSEWSPFR